MKVRPDERGRAIERVRRRLVRGGSPRLLVSFLLALTGAAGFLVSTALLRLGVTQMSVRYPLAVLSAYSVFLLLLRLWLALQRRKTRRRSNSLDPLSDMGDALPHLFDAGANVAGDAARATFGGGADFAGGGAGGVWTDGSAALSNVSDGVSGSVGGSVGGNAGGGSSLLDSVPDVGLDLDLDDGCFWIVIPIAAIVGVLVLMFYVVYVAPVFLAEILVDALLVAGLYRRLKKIEPRHWLRSVVRRTLLPALLATALFIAAGYLMGRIAPEAHSIGSFWREINSPKDRR
ncbi:MAG TPA: hypothetical protein VGO96_09985 [Pyrinomonadaceae bacterium]|nr:hypothetical protein [Pyrinomonadaceae bacterium]